MEPDRTKKTPSALKSEDLDADGLCLDSWGGEIFVFEGWLQCESYFEMYWLWLLSGDPGFIQPSIIFVATGRPRQANTPWTGHQSQDTHTEGQFSVPSTDLNVWIWRLGGNGTAHRNGWDANQGPSPFHWVYIVIKHIFSHSIFLSMKVWLID